MKSLIKTTDELLETETGRALFKWDINMFWALVFRFRKR